MTRELLVSIDQAFAAGKLEATKVTLKEILTQILTEPEGIITYLEARIQGIEETETLLRKLRD